jgi:hypothetical protein
MKIKHYCLLLLLSFVTIQAQEQTENLKSSFITFSLTSPVLSYAPRWNIGYFRILNDSFTIGAEAGYGNSDIALNTFNAEITSDYQVFEIRPELIYTISRIGRTKRFVSAELYFLQHSDAFTTSRYYDDGKQFSYDTADYKRTKYGFNLNYGVMINFTKNFGMIPKFGVGLRFRDINFSNVVGKVERLNNGEENHQFPNTEGYIENAGKQLNLNVAFDIKLFFRL